MATVTVVQPAYGHIDIVSTTMSSYTVRFVETSPSDEFGGFRVTCQYCGRTVYVSTSNPASFDLAALESEGHPGPYVITADTSLHGDVTIVTHVGNAGHGVAFPAMQEVGGAVGSNVSFTIHADPEFGYRFLGWSYYATYNPAQIVSTSANVTITRNVTEPDAVWHYFAHFEKKQYDYRIGVRYYVPNKTFPTGWTRSLMQFRPYSSSDGTSAASLDIRYLGEVRDANGNVIQPSSISAPRFAHVTKSTTQFIYGQTASANLTIDNQAVWDALGLKVIGWIVYYYVPDSPNKTIDDLTISADGKTVSFTADKVTQEAMDTAAGGTSFYDIFVVLGAEQCKLEFSTVPAGAAKLNITAPSSVFIEPMQGIGDKRVAWAAGGETMTLIVEQMLYQFGLIHGWSEQLPDAAGGVAAKSYTMPAQDAEIKVYICSHLLLYGSGGSLLYGASGSLLYDCNVPPNTTVYS